MKGSENASASNLSERGGRTTGATSETENLSIVRVGFAARKWDRVPKRRRLLDLWRGGASSLVVDEMASSGSIRIAIMHPDPNRPGERKFHGFVWIDARELERVVDALAHVICERRRVGGTR